MKRFSFAASAALGIAAAIVAAQSASPKFDVASIRAGCGGGGGGDTKSGPPGTKGGGAVAPSSPGRLSICRPLDDELGGLIEQAYGRFANGQRNPPWAVPQVVGGPAWIRSDFYEISARAENNASIEMMSGPMLQVLLEDRFKLKMHRETREVPVYALTIAKNGPKLRPFKEGSCVPIVWTDVGMMSVPPAPPDKMCRDIIAPMKPPNITVEVQGVTMDALAFLIGRVVERPVIDRTGFKGQFDGDLEFLPDSSTIELPVLGLSPATPPTPRDPAPTIFTAIQEQLGLKLEPTKGPQEVLVIDSVERPTEN